MAFEQVAVKTPTTIPRFRVILKDDGGALSADYDVIVEFDNGDAERKSGNLVPHLTAAQITQLQSFMSTLRTKAEDEFLPSA